MFETLASVSREENGGGSAAQTLAPAMAPTEAGRAEVDTSAPFESVREAVHRFGGSAVWKSQLKQLFDPEKYHCSEEVELLKVGEQTQKLERDLIVKERETLDVLKELELTKKIVDGLKLKLKATSELRKIPEVNPDNMKVHPIVETEHHLKPVGSSKITKHPALILMELKQAKLNLNRTTTDRAGIRAYVESLNREIEVEKGMLEKTRERLNSNTAKVSSLEGELNRIKSELRRINKARSFENPSETSRQFETLNSEEGFVKMTEGDKLEISLLNAEIELIVSSIKTAEIRCLAAKKMEEAAKATEAAALAKIKALKNGENPVISQPSSSITLSAEEYSMLIRKAQDADEASRKKTEAAMLQVEGANRAKMELLMKVEEATAEVETSRKALEEALNREEAANRGKLEVETALRRWRSEQAQRRRSIQSSTKFKNSCLVQRRDSRMLDVNGVSLVSSGSRASGPPMLSIGEILSRKLTGPEEYETAIQEKVTQKPKVSLGQILSRGYGLASPQRADDVTARKQQVSTKRKKFGLAGFSLRFTKQNKRSKRKKMKKKKKRSAWDSQVSCRPKIM